MQYQEFGKTGLRVSKLCLGTWGIGGAGWDSYSDESRMDAIKAALECGINFIDTAPAYNAGKAECYVGETLSKLKKHREVVISTRWKISSLWFKREYFKAVRRVAEKSKDRLY